MDYALSTTVEMAFDDTLTATRARLADEGFGILTEIDLAEPSRRRSTRSSRRRSSSALPARPLAYAALQAEPSIGLLLPCNVLVRALDDDYTLVEAMDPAVMVKVTRNDSLVDVATDARERLSRALSGLTQEATARPPEETQRDLTSRSSTRNPVKDTSWSR